MSGFNTEALEWATDMKERDELDALFKERDELENIMKNEVRLSDSELRTILNLMMVSDPWPLEPIERVVMIDLIQIESQLRGYQDWVEAYHKLNPDKVTDEFMDKVTYE